MKISQSKLARWFGVAQSTVAGWELGYAPISGSAKILMQMLYDEIVNGRTYVVRDFITSIRPGNK
jgi:DNA-binding transcriptional regulator YiaG